MPSPYYWTARPVWQSQTAFIIAGGTSVARQNVAALKGRRVIAVNSSYMLAPFADILFFGDNRWWNVHRERPGIRDFKGRLVTTSKAAVGPNLLKLEKRDPPGLAPEPHAAVVSRTSLTGALNLAMHLGVFRIVLLGADMRRADDGRTHHHEAHPWRNKPGNETWDVQIEQLRTTVEPLKARGIEVINTSPISRLDFFRRANLDSLI